MPEKSFKLSLFDRLSISNEEKLAFLENFGVMLDSGIQIMDIFSSLYDMQKSPGMRKSVGAMKQGIAAGYSISRIFELSDLFPPYVMNLISLGEVSGTLPHSFDMVAEAETRAASFRSKVRSAMMYPIIVIVVALAVGIGISWFILPKLATVFASLNLKLPLITRVFISIGLFLNSDGLVAVPAFFAGLALLLYILFGNRHTKFLGESLMFATPGIHTILLETEVARMGSLLGTLFGSGMPVLLTLHALSESATLRRYKKFYSYLEGEIAAGNSFERSFHEYKGSAKLVPKQVQTLIFSGERTGILAKTFQKIGTRYTEKSEIAVKDLETVIEPILLVVIAGSVLLIALSIILPIYSLTGSISND